MTRLCIINTCWRGFIERFCTLILVSLQYINTTNYLVKTMKKFINNKYRYAIGIVCFLSVTSIPIICYYNNFKNNKVSLSPSDWGAFGDYLGGTLNPLFGLITVILLLYTIHLQRKSLQLSKKELELTRQEMEGSRVALEAQNMSLDLQNFENRFFKQVEILRQEITNFEYSTSDKNDNIKFGRKGVNTLIDEILAKNHIAVELFIKDDGNYWENKEKEYKLFYAHNFYYIDFLHYINTQIKAICSDISGSTFLCDSKRIEYFRKVSLLIDKPILVMFYFYCLGDYEWRIILGKSNFFKTLPGSYSIRTTDPIGQIQFNLDSMHYLFDVKAFGLQSRYIKDLIIRNDIVGF